MGAGAPALQGGRALLVDTESLLAWASLPWIITRRNLGVNPSRRNLALLSQNPVIMKVGNYLDSDCLLWRNIHNIPFIILTLIFSVLMN